MCQGYYGEIAMVRAMEERDNELGHPGGCDFQAGMLQCPNRFNRRALIQKYRNIEYRIEYGWECEFCGTWYPMKENK